MKRTVVLALVAGSVLVACQSDRPLSPNPRRPSADISDGRHTANCGTPTADCVPANPHFFFLPPVVKAPSFSGVFNPDLAPVVEICALNHVDGQCVQSVATFTTGSGPDHVRVLPNLQRYLVVWRTALFHLNPTVIYRIKVSAGSRLLGFADVRLITSLGQLLRLDTKEFVPLPADWSLPIAFRIERGALTTDFLCTDCVEQVVSNAGGTVVTNTGFAGAQFPAGWLPAGFDQVVVTIERVNLADVGGQCIPLSLPQGVGCYRFATLPFVGLFALPATVGSCLELSASDPQHDGAQLFSVEENVLMIITALQNVPAPFLSCEGFAAAPPAGGAMADLVRALGRHVGSWFMPRSLLAAHVGAGGLVGSFSRIGWVLPQTINFDVTPGGDPVSNGEVVNDTYASAGVQFGAVSGGREGCSDGTHVFANTGAGSLATNAVSLCPGEVAGFSDAQDGRLHAGFDAPASKVCIDVAPTGPESTGFLVAFEGGEPTQTVTSTPGAAQVLCVESAGLAALGIERVEFAGTGSTRAIFDNLSVTAAPPPLISLK